MKAFLIINSKNSNVILSKYYKQEALKTVEILKNSIEYNNLNLNKGPILNISDNVVIISEFNTLYYTSIYSNLDCSLTEALFIQETIFKALKINTHPVLPNSEYIKENLINILLMIDFYLLDGVPVIEDHAVLASLIQSYDFSDKITENYIGKPKIYDCSTLEAYLKESQCNKDFLYYTYPYAKKLDKDKVLIDYIDDVNYCVLDKNNCVTDVEMSSKLVLFSLITNKIQLGLTVNFPYKIDEDSLNFSNEVKSSKEALIRNKFIEVSPLNGEHMISKWVPNIFNSKENSQMLVDKTDKSGCKLKNQESSNFSVNSSIRLPFKLNINSYSSTTVSKTISKLYAYIISNTNNNNKS
jgi:hypothetical protein